MQYFIPPPKGVKATNDEDDEDEYDNDTIWLADSSK
jgi:hypothetical protein